MVDSAMDSDWEMEQEWPVEEDEDEGHDLADVEEVVLTPAEWKSKAGDLYKAKDYRGAIRVYTQGIEACTGGDNAGQSLAPAEAKDIAALYGNRAASYVMILGYEQVMKEGAEAIADCDHAAKLDPQFSKALFRKAMALKKLGKFKESVSALQHGLAIDPNNAEQIKEKSDTELCSRKMELASELMSQKQYARTVALLDSCLERAPQSRELKCMKVEALMGLGKHEEAYTLSSVLIRSSQNNPALLITRARCLYLMGNLESAVKHLQEAARQDPDCSEYGVLMRQYKRMESTKEAGNQAFKTNKLQEAIGIWGEALQIDKSNKAFNSKLYCNRAVAFAKVSRHEEAVAEFTLALRDDPSYTKAYEKRAASLYQLGGVENLEAACRDYERVADMVTQDRKREIHDKLRKAQAALKQARRKDYYKLLGVSRGADENEIKKAYRKAALMYHPDRLSSKSEEEREQAGKIFRDIGEAYEVLSDPQKRERYDSGVDLEDLDNPHAGHCARHGGMDIDPSILVQMFMQGGAGRRGAGPGARGGGGGGGVHFKFG